MLGAVLALTLVASAEAAPRLDVDLARDSVRYGTAHRVSGSLLDGTAPLAGQAIVLEGRRYPYEGSDRVIARATTDADGEFDLRAKLDRNHRLRVVAPAAGVRSELLRAYTVPDFELSTRAVRPGVARLYQRYVVPRGVRLTAPTLFYVGRGDAKRASMRLVAKVRRTRPGRYTSVVTFRVPASWDFEYRAASCFRSSPRSGMGDPKLSCPRLRYRF